MQKDKLKQILIYVIPFMAFIVIFGFALACGTSPGEAIESTEKEIKKEIKEEEVGLKRQKLP